MWGRTERCLKETAEEISLAGTECHYFVCDVANREEVYKQAKVVREKVRQCNICIVLLPTREEMCFAHSAMPPRLLSMYAGAELLLLPSGI